MNCRPEDMLLYAVTDRAWLNGETLESQVEKALKGGATFVQLREKELDEEMFLEEAKKIKKLCAEYHVPFVMQSIEPGERIYYNTDEAHLFFPDRYCVRLYEESLLTPCGLIIGEKLEDGEPFETETDVLERFRDCGYPAATLKELELIFDADELIIFEFTNPYLDLEQKNACA